MALTTRLTQRLRIKHPVLLSPMGMTSGGALAAAVSAAGGLGLIGAGFATDSDWVDQQFRLAGNQSVGAGFITWGIADRPEAVDRVLARRPAAVMFSFGDAGAHISKVRQAGIPVICQVQTLALAREALAQGADIIIAQGGEAGGHGGSRGTMALVPAVADLVAREFPHAVVVAAGGIADGRGLAAALMLGAAGVLMGSRFQAAAENLSSDHVKQRMMAASGDRTVRSNLFDIARDAPWPLEFTGRGLANDFSDAWNDRPQELADNAAEKARFTAARTREDYDVAVVWAGEAVDLIGSIEPAGLIVERVVAEAEAALARRFA